MDYPLLFVSFKVNIVSSKASFLSLRVLHLLHTLLVLVITECLRHIRVEQVKLTCVMSAGIAWGAHATQAD